jgi:phage shock protein PspC (stress-responsive transcriptional regulator)
MFKSLLTSEKPTALFDIQANAVKVIMQNFYLALAVVIIIFSIIIWLIIKKKK